MSVICGWRWTFWFKIRCQIWDYWSAIVLLSWLTGYNGASRGCTRTSLTAQCSDCVTAYTTAWATSLGSSTFILFTISYLSCAYNRVTTIVNKLNLQQIYYVGSGHQISIRCWYCLLWQHYCWRYIFSYMMPYQMKTANLFQRLLCLHIKIQQCPLNYTPNLSFSTTWPLHLLTPHSLATCYPHHLTLLLFLWGYSLPTAGPTM